jgi:hypothetical protein
MPPPFPSKPPPPPLPSSRSVAIDRERRLAQEQDVRKRWAVVGGCTLSGLLLLFSLIFYSAGGFSNAGREEGRDRREGRLAAENTDAANQNGKKVHDNETKQSPPVANASAQPNPSDSSNAASENFSANKDGEVERGLDDTGQSNEIEEDSSDPGFVPGLMIVPNRQSQPKLGASQPVTNAKEVDLTSSEGINPFMGEGEKAKTTVFVIDVSGSMQTGDRLPRVLSSLTRAIDHLDENQIFAVFLFDTNYYTIHTSGMIPATTGNKASIKEWLSYRMGGGGTEPMAAMSVAIQLEPERIVLLTDGEFDPLAAAVITQQNMAKKKPARIDCVGLAEEVIVLQEIASQNKGVYYQVW